MAAMADAALICGTVGWILADLDQLLLPEHLAAADSGTRAAQDRIAQAPRRGFEAVLAFDFNPQVPKELILDLGTCEKIALHDWTC